MIYSAVTAWRKDAAGGVAVYEQTEPISTQPRHHVADLAVPHREPLILRHSRRRPTDEILSKRAIPGESAPDVSAACETTPGPVPDLQGANSGRFALIPFVLVVPLVVDFVVFDFVVQLGVRVDIMFVRNFHF